MYAIVEIAGQQFKVQKDRFIYTHRLEAAEGETVTFDKVLLTDNDGTVSVGSPVLSSATVTGKIMAHVRGEKILVFHKKRRKGHKKTNGHRQYLTKVMIENIAI